MPSYTCAKCGNTGVVSGGYTSMKCTRNGCGGTMYQPGGAPTNLPLRQAPPGIRPPIIPPRTVVTRPLPPPPVELPPPIIPPRPTATRPLPPPPPPLDRPAPPIPPRRLVPGPPSAVTAQKTKGPPVVDLAALQTAVSTKHQAAINRARVNKRLVFGMISPGQQRIGFDLPIKYNLWKSDVSTQSPEIEIEIPIKVHNGAEAKRYWLSKGYSDASFGQTFHPLPPVPPATEGLPATGIIGATATEDVLKQWSTKINNCWGKVGVVWVKPSGEEQVYSLRFRFSFVDNAQEAAAEVACVQATGDALSINPTGTVDAIRWGVHDVQADTLGPICHEVGHLIGNPDEYFIIDYNGQTKNWAKGNQTANGIGTMNNPDRPPLMRYYKLLALELANTFSIPPAQAFIVPNAAAPSHSRLRLDAPFWP